MATYIARRLLATIPVIILISLITFFAVALLPGDPVLAVLGEEADLNAVEAIRQQLGLDRPVLVRYFDWIGNAIQGDFGKSVRAGDDVSTLLSKRLEVTLELGILAMMIALMIGIPLGLIAGSRPNTPFDYGGTMFAVLGAAIPNFWLALMLVLFFAVRTALASQPPASPASSMIHSRTCARLSCRPSPSGYSSRPSWRAKRGPPWWRCCDRTTSARPTPKASGGGP